MRKETENKLKKYGIGTGDIVIFVVVIVLVALILAAALGTKHLSRTDPESLSAAPVEGQSVPETAPPVTEGEETLPSAEEDSEESAPEATEAQAGQPAASAAVEQRLAEMTLDEKSISCSS